MAAIKILLSVVFFAVLVCPQLLVAAETVPLPAAIEQQITAAAHDVKTLHSEFAQEKYLSIFEEKLLSSGQFYYQRPDKLRWELLEPVVSGFVLNGDSGKRWHQSIAGSEPFKLKQDRAMSLIAEQLFAWAKADLDWLHKHYEIGVTQQQPIQLCLLPLAENNGFLDHLLITFSPDASYVASVEIHESDGDYTRINFKKTVVNGCIDSDIFADRLSD